MAPKAADKKPASKAPATASKAPEKKDAGKKTAATGDKKKRTKARKETYSSYIYKGTTIKNNCTKQHPILTPLQFSSKSTPIPVFRTVPCRFSTRLSMVCDFVHCGISAYLPTL